jgi:hypothetical protein
MIVLLVGCDKKIQPQHKNDKNTAIEQKVDSLLKLMMIEDKVG